LWDMVNHICFWTPLTTTSTFLLRQRVLLTTPIQRPSWDHFDRTIIIDDRKQSIIYIRFAPTPSILFS